ncbi:MAG: efflux RND transporter periplasmic adaptor subunit [Vicinamibacteria bacterium]
MRRAIFSIVVASSLSACGSPPPPASAGPAAAAADAGSFTVPADQLSHLKIAPAQMVTWSTTIRTTGTVDWDNEHTTQVIAQVSGPITRIVADAGAHVAAGDALLYVASTDVTNAVSSYRKAKNRSDLAQRNLDRSKDLLAHKALSERDFESAQADFNDAATDLQTTLQALKIFGVTQTEITEDEQQDKGIRPELVMRAPLGGTVVQRMVLPGQFIQAATTAAFVISDTSTVWIQGHVYDRDLGSVHPGDKVEAHNAAFPETFHGVVAYVGDMIDPATRTTPVRIVTRNPDKHLKKDLFVDVVIHDKKTQEVLVVPTAAVLYDEQNFPFVYAQLSPGKFEQRQVKLGSQQGDDTQVLDGLKAGEPVVSQGSVFLQFANTNR